MDESNTLTILSQACLPSMKPLGMALGVRISYLQRRGDGEGNREERRRGGERRGGERRGEERRGEERSGEERRGVERSGEERRGGEGGREEL